MVEGQVRGVQTRTEQQGETSEAIWTFRVERYDEAGNRALLVPVEMRGYAFEGSIHDGDWVRATGKMKAGTLRASQVENLTTSADFRAKTLPKPVKAILIALFVAFMVGVFAWVVYGFIVTR